ncbi:hypothetical protein TNCV_3798141 [Trichonephila clavipes]|nr:hypothetical protein TNCV_3798141 [Trichonephila clavipes]
MVWKLQAQVSSSSLDQSSKLTSSSPVALVPLQSVTMNDFSGSSFLPTDSGRVDSVEWRSPSAGTSQITRKGYTCCQIHGRPVPLVKRPMHVKSIEALSPQVSFSSLNRAKRKVVVSIEVREKKFLFKNTEYLRDCGSPVVKVSDHGRHVKSSSLVPLKTRRVGQRCTLNLLRAETSSRWCVAVVRRGDASSGVVHVT